MNKQQHNIYKKKNVQCGDEEDLYGSTPVINLYAAPVPHVSVTITYTPLGLPWPALPRKL